jgi:Holliday junction resolvase RusA-like endonuclease
MGMSYTFVAEGRPATKGRPQFNRKTGNAYTPQKTRDAEKALRDQYEGPCFTGPVAVHIDYSMDGQVITITELDPSLESKMRGDLDNYVKLSLDALNQTAWVDDKQVFEESARKALT